MKMMFCQKDREQTKRVLSVILGICLILPVFLASCTQISVREDIFFTMDTLAQSTVITKSDGRGKELNAKIKEICAETEGRISNTIETSEIYKLNEYMSVGGDLPIGFDLSEETAGLLKTARYIKEVTDGAFNPFLGEIIDLWDINNPDETAPHKLPEKDDFYPALDRLKYCDFTITETENGGVMRLESERRVPKIDLGGIGKGYAADKIGGYLSGENMRNALVTFTSSILALGKNKSGNLWKIGVKNPLNPEKMCGYIEASDKIISVSGGYERFITIGGIDYCHIIDPETGRPVDNDLLCVVVVTNAQSASQSPETREKYKNSGAVSDALSTALYVMGKDKALEFYGSKNIFDFEMILFVKSGNSKGYEAISTNIIFNEID